MPILRADRGPVVRRALTGLVTLGLLAGPLAACGQDTAAPTAEAPGAPSASVPATGRSAPASGRPRTPAATSAAPGSGVAVPVDVAAALARLLDQRASALMAGDRAAFTAGLDRASAGFVTAQLGYFDNLRQLPVGSLAYAVEPASLVREQGARLAYTAVVSMTMQLDGFDTAPVTRLDQVRIVRAGGGFRLASAGDADWSRAHGQVHQPWDDEPVTVRTARGTDGSQVLGVFDAGTASDAQPLTDAMAIAADAVGSLVPYGWDRRVVFYALSDESFADQIGLTPSPGGAEPDAVAFTVPAGPQDPTAVATRVLLGRSVVTARGAVRDRLLRHELTHVAVGDHDATAPAWLTEGLAEWVSAQGLPRAATAPTSAGIRRAETTPVRMPAPAEFAATPVADRSQALGAYAIAGWSIIALARHDGDAAPWSLLDAMSTGTPVTASVRQVAGRSVDGLARRGARLLLRAAGITSSSGGGAGGTGDGGTGH